VLPAQLRQSRRPSGCRVPPPDTSSWALHPYAGAGAGRPDRDRQIEGQPDGDPNRLACRRTNLEHPLKLAKHKAVAAAATITTITALAVVTTQGTEQSKATLVTSEVEFAQLLTTNQARLDAAVAVQQAEAAAAEVAAAEAAAAQAAAAQVAAAQAAAGAAAAQEAERRAVARQAAQATLAQERAARAARTAQAAPARVAAPASRSRGTTARVPAPAAATTSSGSSAAGRAALAQAPRHQGKPYEYGETGPNSFDCSGFTSYLFAQQGKQLPRTSSDQYAASTKVTKGSQQPGDLIFTYGDGGIYHVGIYAGDNTMWAATKSGDVVRKQAIWTSQYYVGRFA
jgi:cell wall-associated NlpC family hydrolase